MTDLVLPAFMLAWKTSGEVVRMEEWPAPKFSFDDPYEEEEDRLSKVTCYWKAHDQERTQRESRYRELLDAEEAAALRKQSEDATRELKKAQEAEKTKEKERKKEIGTGEREREGKGEGSGTPTPKKFQHDLLLESEEGEGEEEEEDDSPQSCIYCMKKKIPCVPQNGKKVCVACGRHKMKCEYFDKTAWAVMEGSKKISESIRELVNLEKPQEAGHLEVVWHDLRMFLIEVEQKAVADSVAADTRVLQLLELKSKGVSVPEDLEKWIRAECGLVQEILKENTEDLTEWMDHIWKCTA
ncbi:hypothetical protein M422DRAFT_263443 [Sphaerobolus stellatus SS14]|uniref:Zn(2)-C6 fungal-type domain-containing protein n=1 Tax=Sphaerobolus stellatus (strain SS14) TaxID=990650 RepID=A0A0C9VAH7_SPHS4|nr:hypothetical protein M422DRAFT_263443 [Sphaerobolus stellatus SS14]